jgi:DNA-binding NtrC family response regulator
VVDDSIDTRELLQRNLSAQGYEVLTAADASEALRILGMRHVDLVITDFKMPGASGLDLVRHIRENLKTTEVMMITGFPSVEGAVKAIKSGAGEYLSKPFTKEELFAAVSRVMERLSLRKASQASSERPIANPLGMLGESDAMQAVFKAVARAASSITPVLITGENGTGKELLARAIHYGSSRARAPFVSINCTGSPEELFERQLFGYISGGPNGKTEAHLGFLQLVDGGTLYLEEVSELPYAMQTGLLHVLEEREFQVLGSTDSHAASFRLIAASDRDLRALVNEGVFRDDLYIRLSMNVLAVPALRERGNDVLLLARHFLNELSKGVTKSVPRLSDHAMEVVKSYAWPGNIGELQNIISQLLHSTESDIIDVPDFPPHMRFSVAEVSILNRSLATVEAEHIRNVIAAAGGNKTRAAEILGINRKTLREKLKQSESTAPGS